MMKTIRADTLGFCMGVRRAVDLADRTRTQHPGVRVFTLGPLIHNPRVVADLAQHGVEAVSADELDERLEGAYIVIRAHGVPPAVRARLVTLGAHIVDATCPRVIASQRRAAAFSDEGRDVVIVGDKDHGEVAGIAGYANRCSIVGSPAEAANLELSSRVGVIAQTTIKQEEYRAVIDVLRVKCPDMRIVDSICPATEERQAALIRLSAIVDAIVIVGGRTSANTGRLYRTALELGKPAWHVEGATDLPAEAWNVDTVGITAGASTPDSEVEEIERALHDTKLRDGTS